MMANQTAQIEELKKTYQYIGFTDGACSGNPGPGGWGSVLVNLTSQKVLELGGASPSTTNNQMELTAVIEALKVLPKFKISGDPGRAKVNGDKKILILTDSKYVISGISHWVHGWIRSGWLTKGREPVKNQDLWQALLTEVQLRSVEFKYIPGHSGLVGNERADELAVQYRDLALVNSEVFEAHKPHLFFDFYQLYPYSLFPIPENILSGKEENSKDGKQKNEERQSLGGSPYYISYVNGVYSVHETWNSCQRQVEGKTNAKFKKVKNKTEEMEFKKKWGV